MSSSTFSHPLLFRRRPCTTTTISIATVTIPHKQLILFFLLILSILPQSLSRTLPAPLKDVDLRCCTLPEPPIIERDETTTEGYGGIAMEYLSQLQSKLGFRCASLDIYTAPNGEISTFDQAVQNLFSCSVNGAINATNPDCKCDIGIGGWSLNDKRVGVADFVQPFLFDYYRVITHANNTASPAGDVFFFTAFTSTVWICVFVLIATFAILKILDLEFAPDTGVKEEKPPMTEDASRWRRLSEKMDLKTHSQRANQVFQSISATMMGYSGEEVQGDMHTMRQWTLNFVIFLSGLFLVLTYEASMTNALVNEIWTSKFNGLQDFKKCKIPADKVCLIKGSGVHAFWKRAIETQPCHKRGNAPKVQTRKTLKSTFEALLQNECQYMVGLGVQLQLFTKGPHCQHVRMTGDPFRDTGVSFILPHQSNLTQRFSNATLELRHSDLIATPERFLAQKGECIEGSFRPITFVKLIWFFILVFIASGVIFVVMVYTGCKARRGQAA